MARDEEGPVDCPRCEGKLKAEVYGGVEVDRCKACKGLWLDAEELKRARNELVTGAAGKLDSEEPPEPAGSKGKRQCPRDQRPLETFNYAYSSGIELDRCAACDGLWLDHGEFEKIEEFMRRAETAELPVAAKLAIAQAKERQLTKELDRRRQASKVGPGGSSPVMRFVAWLSGRS